MAVTILRLYWSPQKEDPYKDGYTKIVQNTQILTKIFGIFKN